MRTQDVLWRVEGQEEEAPTGSFVTGDSTILSGDMPAKEGQSGGTISKFGGVNIRGGGDVYIDIGGSNISQKSITGSRELPAQPEGGIDAIFADLSDDLNNSENETMKPIAEFQLAQLKEEAAKGDGASWAVVENGLNMLVKLMPDLAAKAIDRFSISDSGLPTVFSSVAETMQNN
jgi:hypothetical protein